MHVSVREHRLCLTSSFKVPSANPDIYLAVLSISWLRESSTHNRAMKTIKIADGQVWMMRGLHAVITAVGDLMLYTVVSSLQRVSTWVLFPVRDSGGDIESDMSDTNLWPKHLWHITLHISLTQEQACQLRYHVVINVENSILTGWKLWLILLQWN